MKSHLVSQQWQSKDFCDFLFWHFDVFYGSTFNSSNDEIKILIIYIPSTIFKHIKVNPLFNQQGIQFMPRDFIYQLISHWNLSFLSIKPGLNELKWQINFYMIFWVIDIGMRTNYIEKLNTKVQFWNSLKVNITKDTRKKLEDTAVWNTVSVITKIKTIDWIM